MRWPLLDFRSDIYSLGCTAYVGLVGSLPFHGESPFAIMLKHKSDPPPLVRDRVPEVDPRIDGMIQRMMAKRPEDRYQSHAELVQVTEQLMVELGASRRLGSGGFNSIQVPEHGEASPVDKGFADEVDDSLPPSMDADDDMVAAIPQPCRCIHNPRPTCRRRRWYCQRMNAEQSQAL